MGTASPSERMWTSPSAGRSSTHKTIALGSALTRPADSRQQHWQAQCARPRHQRCQPCGLPSHQVARERGQHEPWVWLGVVPPRQSEVPQASARRARPRAPTGPVPARPRATRDRLPHRAVAPQVCGIFTRTGHRGSTLAGIARRRKHHGRRLNEQKREILAARISRFRQIDEGGAVISTRPSSYYAVGPNPSTR
jgi:hypothetical protein